MLPILWTEDARQDMVTTITWIAQENTLAAEKVNSAIMDAVKSLAFLPHGRAGRVDGTYEKIVSGLPYIVAYTIGEVESRAALVVLRVIHTARDWRMNLWPTT